MNTPSALLESLTDPQRRAVTHVDGPLLVLAGPGSGKTTVVTRRIAALIGRGIAPSSILALTFTNKAAGEMRNRVETLLGADGPGPVPTVATFHSFCVRLLRRLADAAELSPRFTIYDAADQRAAMKLAIADAGLSTQNWPPAQVASHVSNAKNILVDAAAFAKSASDFFSRQIAKAYTAYAKLLRANDALDFDDLLMVTAKLIRDDEAIRRMLQERYRYLLIDEYQDTNHAQFVIAHTLAAAHRNICVVGDPDQSIYAWRGADISNILEFEEHYPNATIVPLGQNFRSTGHIVKVADGLIRHNRRRRHKDLHTDLGEGERPSVVICRSEHHEASVVAEFLREQHETSDLPWREMSVLYRVNALSRVLEDALRNAEIPYVIARGTAFYDRKEVKEALGYLRVIANPADEVSLRRIVNQPPRGIGKTTLQKIELFAIDRQLTLEAAMRHVHEIVDLGPRPVAAVGRFTAMLDALRAEADGPPELLESNPLAQLVERVVIESGLEKLYRKVDLEEDAQRVENLAELISAAAQHRARADEEPPADLLEKLSSFLESVALVADADMIDPERGTVTLMTLHAAKGLEFAAVALIGLEERLLPHSRAADSDTDLEEERRLCFVGITRARRALQISRAAVRTIRGMSERTIASRFLAELPHESVTLVDRTTSGVDTGEASWSDDMLHRGSPSEESLSEFPVGCVVRHPRFGLGRVESIMHRASGSSARVSFPTAGTKTLILEHAPLERVD